MAILSALQETTVHPTADWVYAKLKPRYPNLSLGTVYRNLKKFCETGKAVSVGVINGQEHFDGRVEPHAHFVCKRCGAVLDVPEEFFKPQELAELSDRFHLKLENARVSFEGVCPQCEEGLSCSAAICVSTLYTILKMEEFNHEKVCMYCVRLCVRGRGCP